MKILGILTLTNEGKFVLYPLEGLFISETYPTTTPTPNAIPSVNSTPRDDIPSGVITPPTPEEDKISKEVEQPKNIDEVLDKIKKKEGEKK